MARRTKEEAQETKNRILDTAEQVFQEKGVSRTSLNEIAEAAGVTRGAIYWHFTNKVDLFDAMMARVILPMEERETGGCGRTDDPLAYVRACGLDILRRTATDPHCQRVFEIITYKCEYVDEMAQVRERHVEGRGQCLARIERGLRNAIRLGQLPKSTNARRAAIGMHALIDGLISNWVLDPGYFRLAAEAAKIVDVYLAGLKIEIVSARRSSTRNGSAKALTKAPRTTATKLAVKP